ncbi:MAG: helix-turn-helix domain-containing protein [Phycisphaeraceae bacterium]
MIADDVSRLKAEKMTMPKIIEWLTEHRGTDVSVATVRRAWHYANLEAVKQAVEKRSAPAERNRYSHLPAEKIDRIKQMLTDGHQVTEIAEVAGFGKSTVYRIRRGL